MPSTRLFLLLLTVVLVSCNNDDPNKIPAQPGNNSSQNYVDPAFRTYVERFYYEMELRGTNVRNVPLTLVFVDEFSGVQGNYCGYAYYFNNGLVEILNSNNCWYSRTEIERENLIYHELGHALLTRPHRSGNLSNGMFNSLMCTGACNNYRVYNQYQVQQRSYYLDELLNQSTAPPDWASEKLFSRVLAEDEITLETQLDWDTLTVDSAPSEIPYSYHIATQNTSSLPFALQISATGDNSTNAYGYWYKDFPISEFENCSNVTVTGNIITEGLTNGFVSLVVDLVDDTGNRFHRFATTIDNYNPGTGTYEDVETKALCLPLETEMVRVLFYFNSLNEASVYLDDLLLDVYE